MEKITAMNHAKAGSNNMDRTVGLGSEPVVGIWVISFEPENIRNQGININIWLHKFNVLFFFLTSIPPCF